MPVLFPASNSKTLIATLPQMPRSIARVMPAFFWQVALRGESRSALISALLGTFVGTLRVIARLVRPLVASLLLATALGVPLHARADELADVTRLYRSGQVDEASRRADTYLKTNPRDPRMRFLKGVMLMEQRQPTEAQAVFERLTQDYPELPEPYNNLAVLYASQGDYTRARIALEMVVRNNPNYPLAYENLGDVHLKLASQAYANAQRLDAANVSVGAKLAAVTELLAPVPSGVPASSAPASPPATSPAPPSAPALPVPQP